MAKKRPATPVILITEDPYTMAAVNRLLATDWRFQVAEKHTSLTQCLAHTRMRAGDGLIVIETDQPGDKHLERLRGKGFRGEIVLLTQGLSLRAFRGFHLETVNGVLIKKEIGYCLGWALDYCRQGYWVMSPGVSNWTASQPPSPRHKLMILSQPDHQYGLTPRQQEAFWLGIILGLDHRTMAEELSITEGSSYGLISAIYRRLDIDNLLRGESELEKFIPEEQTLASTCKEIQKEVRKTGSTHIRDKAELVFHLFTHPEIS
jgi:DNA-binding NarL/FixJ family response regulator